MTNYIRRLEHGVSKLSGKGLPTQPLNVKWLSMDRVVKCLLVHGAQKVTRELDPQADVDVELQLARALRELFGAEFRHRCGVWTNK